jgi:3'-phosphoadenosine 5'-phosphosulfate sulfotransferase (PAPS reductase)/FAD synthetase
MTDIVRKIVIFASYGNDSIALIQLCHEAKLLDLPGITIDVLYSDTGWSIPWWNDRVEKAEVWVRDLGFAPYRTHSVGFQQLVKNKQFFPVSGMQFCTEKLKLEPALAWLDEHDPDKKVICFVGVRREESVKRSTYEKVTLSSPAHGYRQSWAPMADYDEEDRDELIKAAGFDVLPHRSKECFPCINAARSDLVMVSGYPERVKDIRKMEEERGRTMFKPEHHMGATGIDEILRWAHSNRGSYRPPVEDPGNCDGGFCGT